MLPLIGLLLDWVPESTCSKRPHYYLREHYFNAIHAAGGIPVAMPYNLELLQTYLERVQGVLIPGGDYPTPQEWYATPPPVAGAAHPRPQAESWLIAELLRRNLPLLGICAGMQVLSVVSGGKLHWRVAEALNSPLRHRACVMEACDHPVSITPGSLLHRLTGVAEMVVNSYHNEGVANVGPDMTITATAPDGVVEAVEVPAHRFALGVQWHPELTAANPDHPDARLFAGLIAAAAGV